MVPDSHPSSTFGICQSEQSLRRTHNREQETVMLSGHAAAPHPRSMKVLAFDADFANDGIAMVYVARPKHFQSRYSEASGLVLRMGQMFRSIFVGGVYSPTIFRSWWASTPTLQGCSEAPQFA